ncbi:leucyl aminopeptidase [Psittacicella melopsittaci]|uniref:Probable cytosol aminopeptidase n=1 Tax=Psittacicella melopsittaci TaxID=2028576 RepID=A0A3A1Y8B2_9GAMM|nr:leucyl aminopeptidase [Psittacicella melopsittaci]RIY33459.1 leucyl aminopeptidase [Psittacicella melopsittaci]
MLFNVVHTLQHGKEDTLVLFANTEGKLVRTNDLNADTVADVERLLVLDNFKGSTGEVSHFYSVAGLTGFTRVIVAGVGKYDAEHKLTAKALKKVADKLVKKLVEVKASSLTLLLPEDLLTTAEASDAPYHTALVFVEAINFSRYKFKRFLTLDKPEEGHADNCSCCTGVKSYHFYVTPEHAAAFEAGLADARCISAGVKLARDLGNLPGNICTPRYLADQGEKLARDYDNITTEVLDENALEALGMGCYLAVGKGSSNRPYMTVVKYNGAPDSNQRPYVFVGKGMTFDTGGYSLKPAASMEEMKYDMCGAASVLGLVKAVAELNLPINLVGVVAGCENLISSTSYRPGDILKSMNGLTVEVNNTDAEGRLVLCDALTYVARFNPLKVIDIATLTGACMVALGSRITGVFSTRDEFARELVEAGEYVDDRGWHLPLDDDFRADMRGNHADLTNAGSRFGGASTAAAFLSYFTKDYDWAHLDVAGTAWVSGKYHLATGRPVSLMTRWLQNQVMQAE